MNMKALFLFFLHAILTMSPAAAQNEATIVPEGTRPTIDGVIHTAEWEDALQLQLRGGRFVYVKYSGSYFYVAIRGSAGGISSVCLNSSDTIRVLHSSTALITASYARIGNQWQLIHSFRGPQNRSGHRFAREERRTEAYRKAQLEQFDWLANIVEEGDPTDTEFQIGLRSLDTAGFSMSVAFLQARAQVRIAHSPISLEDASLDTELIAGTANDNLQFEPDGWHLLRW